MREDVLTVKELIEELQELEQDSKVFMNKWYKKENGEWGSNSVPIVKGIGEAIDLDTCKVVYAIETQCKDIQAILDSYMDGLSYEYPKK